MSAAERAEKFAEEYHKSCDLVRTGERWERERARQRKAAILRAVREAHLTREFNCIMTGHALIEPE